MAEVESTARGISRHPHRRAVRGDGTDTPLAGLGAGGVPLAPSATERLASALLGQTSDAVFIVGRDFRIEWWGRRAEELLGVRAGEAVGRYCFDVVRGEHLARGLRCGPTCWAMQSARRGMPVPPFCVALHCNGASGVYTLGFFAGGSGEDVVHVLRPAIEMVALTRTTVERAAAEGEESSRSRVDRLTPREQEILGLVADGLSARQIAARLSISHATARNHVQNVLIRLGVHRRVDAAVLALHAGVRVLGPKSALPE